MTTSLAYEELLAFEGLQNAVDQLYRAYLDARIVEAKRASKSDRHGYWKNLREFRKSELEPATPDEYPEKAKPRKQDEAADKDLEEKRTKKAELSAFLYWFDVRARFWWSDAADSFVLDDFPYAEELLLLNAQAEALKARLKRLKKIYDKKAKGGAQATPDSSLLDKLKRQVDDSVKYSTLVEQVISAHNAQPKPAKNHPK